MRPLLHPRLTNKPFDDPGLFITFPFEKRAILFDLGEIYSLASKDVLKTSHVFVTHTHMDHFAGFDRLLRLFLGREKNLYIYGPEGFLSNLEGKLAGYSWNLVEQYKTGLTLHATEVHPDHLITRRYLCTSRFVPEKDDAIQPYAGILLEEPGLSVLARIFDHKMPCLGFAIKEKFHVNILKNRLDDLGLETGPWLKKFKQALYSRYDPDTEFEVQAGQAGLQKRVFGLKDLADRIAVITSGQKIAYIADVAYSRSNVAGIVELAKDADHLFIEAVFLEKHQELAKRKHHLTAGQAGALAALARVKRFTIFHFSPRYHGLEHLLQKEAQEAYEKPDSPW